MKTAHLTKKFKFKSDPVKTYGPIAARFNSITEDQWLTPREAAEHLRIGYKRLLNMSSSGKVPYRKLGRLNRYSKRELDLLLETQRRGLKL